MTVASEKPYSFYVSR